MTQTADKLKFAKPVEEYQPEVGKGQTEPTREEQRRAKLKRPPKLHDWCDLTEPVENLPPAVAVALSTGRPELALSALRDLQAGKLDDKQVGGLIKLCRVLIETNQALQFHARDTSELAEQLRGAAKNVNLKICQLADLANFRDPLEDYGQDADTDPL